MSEEKNTDELSKSGQEATSESPENSEATKTSPESPNEDSEKKTTEDNEDGTADEQSADEETFTIDDTINAAGYGKFQKVLTFLAGIGWLADAFEVLILSIIGDLMACEWTIRRWQNALMTSVVFGGMTIGAPVFGNFADRFGRRIALAISMIVIFIFGGASAASPTLVWMIALRGLTGFALGGIAQGVTLSCEYYPANMRGRAGFYLSYYFALGTIFMVLSAWIIMEFTDNWRLFVFIAAVPALLVFLTMPWYPESARYYLVSNQPEKAMAVLQRMIDMNKKEMPKGKLVEIDVESEKGQMLDLLKPEMRRATLLFWYIWFAIACCYYGIALITPYIITHDSLLSASKDYENTTLIEDFQSIMPCKKFTTQNFIDLLWTSAAEFPGILLFTFTVEYFPRKVFLGTTSLILSFLMLFLMLEMKPQIALFLVLFVVRALVAGVFQLLFIMTTEAFPTTLRASAMGTGSGMARFGGLIIPYLAQVAVISKPIPSIFAMAGIGALAGIASLLLPMETRGIHMKVFYDGENIPLNNHFLLIFDPSLTFFILLFRTGFIYGTF